MQQEHIQQEQQKTQIKTVNWQAWQWQTPEGFWLRGVHTVPRGLPVLHFIHGNSYCGRTYEPLWQELNTYFDVFLHDVQGHGDSDFGGKFVGWQRSAELASAVWHNYRQAWPQVPHIGMGHSFGGVLTSMLAVAEPDLFNRLLLLDPILMPPRYTRWVDPLQCLGVYQFNSFAKRARQRRQCWPDAASAHASLAGRGMFQGWSPQALQAYIDYGMQQTEQGVQLKCSPQREAETFGSYMPALWRQLPQLQVPTHIIYGDKTYPFLHESMAKLNRLQTVSSEITEGGHCFMLEQPTAIAHRIREHLQAVL